MIHSHSGGTLFQGPPHIELLDYVMITRALMKELHLKPEHIKMLAGFSVAYVDSVGDNVEDEELNKMHAEFEQIVELIFNETGIGAFENEQRNN